MASKSKADKDRDSHVARARILQADSGGIEARAARLRAMNAAGQMKIAKAVETLKFSERGRAAMGQLHDFLRDTGLSLDGPNRDAVTMLLQQAFGDFPGSVLDYLSPYSKQ